MAKTKKHAPGLYKKATQQEAAKLAGGSPCNRRFTAQAKHAANDNEGDALSDDAISSTDPRKTLINYGDDNECDASTNKGINDEEVEEDGDNCHDAENEEEGDGDGNENEEGSEDDSDDEEGDYDEDDDDNEGTDED
jgi:hypothetical protein